MEENKTKVSDELLLEIQSLRDRITKNVISIGKVNTELFFGKEEILNIENELKNLYEEARIISQEESKLQEKVSNTLGEGELDFSTGIFTKKQ